MKNLVKNLWLVTAIFLMSLSIVHNAAAFSTDDRQYQNSDGSPKFTDPDEEMPGFMITPHNDNAETPTGPLSFGGAVTPPAPGDNNEGAMAFERAFAHQQDKQ